MNPRKACVTAKYLDLPLKYHLVDGGRGEHTSPAYLALNPNGKVPLLVDGDLKLWESAAIMVHLANKAGSPIWPAHDPTAQVEVMRWLSWDFCHWVAHVGAFYFEYFIKPRFLGDHTPDTRSLEAQTPQLHASARILDAHLARHEFVANDALSIADFALGVLLPYAREIHLPLDEFRNIHRWHDGLMQLEAWRDPWPH